MTTETAARVIGRCELGGVSGLSAEPYREVVRRSVPGGRLLRAWPLEGGSSAVVTALEVAVGPSLRQTLVVRQHGQSQLERHPEVAADEYRVLRALATTAVPAPKPVFVDRSSEVLGQPYLVVEYIEGGPGDAPDDAAWVAAELAAQLAVVHGVAIGELLWLPRQADLVTRELACGLDAARLGPELSAAADLLKAAWPWPAAARVDAGGMVLLHGDFWSGNVLWREGRVVGLVDWEDAALGDPAADLANGRLEALWAYGERAMQVFTTRYYEHAGREFGGIGLGYWDLWTAVVTAAKMAGWGLDAPTEARMREQGRWFAGKALAAVKRGGMISWRSRS